MSRHKSPEHEWYQACHEQEDEYGHYVYSHCRTGDKCETNGKHPSVLRNTNRKPEGDYECEIKQQHPEYGRDSHLLPFTFRTLGDIIASRVS